MTYRGVTRALTPFVILEGVLVCHLSLRLMFAVRIVICINFKVCDKLEVYLRTWQYTASGMHESLVSAVRGAISSSEKDCFFLLFANFAN